MTATSVERALVLSGGGGTGIAYGLGLLYGLEQQGLSLRDADLIVGTSAGSIVGTHLRGAESLEAPYAQQLQPPTEPAPTFDFNAFMQLDRIGADAEPLQRRRLIGAEALRTVTMTVEARKAQNAARLLGRTEWPVGRLLVTAVDVESGELRLFDRDAGVALLDAVTASTALPVVYPPVPIQGRTYMDGGIRSITNADVATGASRVLVLTLMDLGTRQPELDREVATLQKAGAEVKVIGLDDDARSAIGPSPFDPARRAPTARAGLARGQALVTEVKDFWHRA